MNFWKITKQGSTRLVRVNERLRNEREMPGYFEAVLEEDPRDIARAPTRRMK